MTTIPQIVPAAQGPALVAPPPAPQPRAAAAARPGPAPASPVADAAGPGSRSGWRAHGEAKLAAAGNKPTDTHCACGAPIIKLKGSRMCHACYERNRRANPPVRLAPIDYILSKATLLESGCWCWTGRLKDGYGELYLGGRRVRAHRFTYEYFRSEIPPGLVIDHLCRNRACINPWHMEPVTRKVNSLRGEAPQIIAWRDDRCGRGHDLRDAYVRPDTGTRMCRECQRERGRARRQERRLAA